MPRPLLRLAVVLALIVRLVPSASASAQALPSAQAPSAAQGTPIAQAPPEAPMPPPPPPPLPPPVQRPSPDETVVVIGAAPGIETAPASAATSVPRIHLERRAPEHLAQALETVPGVGLVSEGHAAVPAIRGLARGRTLILLDGARVTAERRVGPSATFLDPLVVEAIDVARGPGAVAYGSDAIGGIIAIRTRRTAAGEPLYLQATGQGGVGVPAWRTGLALGRGLGHGGVFVAAHARHADDYDGPDGRVINSSWADRGALVTATQQLGTGLFAMSWQGDTAHDVGRPRSNSAVVRITAPFERSQRVTSSWQTSDDRASQFRVTGFYGRMHQRTDQQALNAAGGVDRIERADVSAHDLQVRAVTSGLVSRILIEGGVDTFGRVGLHAADAVIVLEGAGSSSTASFGPDAASIDDARRVNIGAFLRASVQTSARVTLAAGVRADDVRSRSRGGVFGARSTRHGAVSGFVSGTLQLVDALSLTGQLSRGFRDPTLSDRYYRGPSGRGFITGNPDLRPERSTQGDVALRYRHRAGQIALHAYEYRVLDLVERYETDPDQFFFRNRETARLRGLELESVVRLEGGVTLEASGQVARGTTSAGLSLDDIAPPTFSMTARKTLGARGFTQARLWMFASDDRPGVTEVRTPGATVLDIGAGWRVTRRIDIRALVRNAFDATYYASPDPRWVHAPGRSASITVVVGQ